MRKIILFICFLPAIFLLNSCGGVVGNIEKYPFPNVNPATLKAALKSVYIKYPELKKPDTTMYGKNNGDDFYYLLDEDGTKRVFVCHVIGYPAPYDKEIDLSLTSATILGEVMNMAPNMGYFEKRRYKKLFEKYILPKIKKELNEDN